MTVDPDAAAILEVVRQRPEPDYANRPAAEIAAQLRASPTTPPEGTSPVTTRNLTIPGPTRAIPARLYTPPGAGPFPILVNFHGGGWVMGTLDLDEAKNLRMAEQAGCVILSVDYCLAPEHPFPAPLEECYAATLWAAEHAAEIGGDPGRVGVTGGSAGGNLAAAVALLARERGAPRLGFQLLAYPVCSPDLTTPSYRDNGEGFGLTLAAMRWFWTQYCPAGEAQMRDPLAAPLLAKDLSGLPPAVVIVAGYDPLRDEGVAYAERLEAAGVQTELIRAEGLLHGFLSSSPNAASSRAVIDRCAAAMRAAFA